MLEAVSEMPCHETCILNDIGWKMIAEMLHHYTFKCMHALEHAWEAKLHTIFLSLKRACFPDFVSKEKMMRDSMKRHLISLCVQHRKNVSSIKLMKSSLFHAWTSPQNDGHDVISELDDHDCIIITMETSFLFIHFLYAPPSFAWYQNFLALHGYSWTRSHSCSRLIFTRYLYTLSGARIDSVPTDSLSLLEILKGPHLIFVLRSSHILLLSLF